MKPLCSLLLALAFSLSSDAAYALVPGLLNYQGRITVGSTNFDGSGKFKFALINASGSTTYWSNDGTSTAGSEPSAAVALTVTKGLYAVQLGDSALTNMATLPSSVFAHDDVKLRVWFNDGSTGFQLLAPDKRIAAVGYAMMAESMADGAVTESKLASAAVTESKVGTGAITESKIGNGAVTGGKIASGAIDSTHLAPGLTLAGTTSGTFSGGLTGNVAGNATNFTGSLAGDVTGTQSATSIAAATVTGKALAGFSSSSGTLTAADSLLSALGKLDGNVALKAPLASPTFTGTVSGSFNGPLTGNVTGNASGSAGSFTGSLAGDVTGTQGATAISATTVTSKALTGFSSTTGAVSSSDTVLSAINKLYGNDALKAPVASPTFTGTVSGSFSGPLTGNVAGNVSGSAGSFTGSLAGDVTGTQGATAISATTVTGKTLSGFSSTTGTVSAADTILSAINKLYGNDALKAPLASPAFTGTVTLPTGNATSAPLLLKSGANLTTPVFGALEFDGTNLYVTNNSGTPTRKTVAYTDSVTAAPAPLWVLEDVKSYGVGGGSAGAGTWDTRTLNTVTVDSGPACTLSLNWFTLQPGTYTIRASAPAYYVYKHKIRLYNITDNAIVAYGSSEYAYSNVQTRSTLTARVQLTSAKVFRIEHQVSNSSSSTGLGYPSGLGTADEVYTIVEISQ